MQIKKISSLWQTQNCIVKLFLAVCDTCSKDRIELLNLSYYIKNCVTQFYKIKIILTYKYIFKSYIVKLIALS